MKNNQLYLLFLLFLFSNWSWADTIVCPTKGNKTKINEYISFFIDTTFKLTIDEVWEQQATLFSNSIYKKIVSSRKRQEGIIWGKFQISNPTNKNLTYTIEVDDVFLNRFHLYTFPIHNQDTFTIEKSGINYPFQVRSLPYRKHISILEIPSKSTIEYYLMADKYGKAVRLNLTLWELTPFVAQFIESNFITGIFYGFSLSILLLTIIIYVQFKDTFTLGYIFYLLSSILFAVSNSGLLFQYFLDGVHPLFIELTRPWILFMGFSGLVIFVHHFFNNPIIFPRLNVARKWFHRFYSFLFIIGSPIYFFIPKSEWIWFITLFSTSGSFLCLFGVIISFLIVFKAYRKHKTTEALLLFSVYLLLFFYLGAFIINIYFYKLFTLPPIIAENVSLIFSIVESLLMSVAIFIRIRRMINDKNALQLKVEQQKLALANSIIIGAEKERERIAKELHDSIGSYLSTIGIYTDQLKTPTKEKEKIRTLVNDTHREVRRISDALLPMGFNRFGLIETIKNLCDDLDKNHKMSVRLITNIKKIQLTNEQQLHLYRIAQELTNNAVKHSKAKKLVVQILMDEDGLVLSVEDDGIGFDKEKVEAEKATAFYSIRSRCQSLGADLHIETMPENGTMIFLEMKI